MVRELVAPFKGTFQGIVTDVSRLEVTSQGNAKRTFRLVDCAGAYLNCCALQHNATSASLVDKEEVVLYFASGRGPIGTSPGASYLFKDSLSVSVGRSILPPVKRTLIEISNKGQ